MGAYGVDIGSNIAELLLRLSDALPPGVMLRTGMTSLCPNIVRFVFRKLPSAGNSPDADTPGASNQTMLPFAGWFPTPDLEAFPDCNVTACAKGVCVLAVPRPKPTP